MQRHGIQLRLWSGRGIGGLWKCLVHERYGLEQSKHYTGWQLFQRQRLQRFDARLDCPRAAYR
jgi:hypothetical protein